MTAPEFREVFMCKLTTATSCYSASREVSKETQSSFFATERHVLEMKLDNTSTNAAEDDDDGVEETRGDRSITPSTDDAINFNEDLRLLQKNRISFTEDFVPIPAGIPRRIAKKLICVGYSHCQGWEAFVLLDTSRAQESSEQQRQQRQQQQYADDDKTIVSTTSAAAAGGGGAGSSNHNNNSSNNNNNNSSTPRPIRRRSSSGNASVSSTDTGTTSLASSTTASTVTPSVITIDKGTGGGTAATTATATGSSTINKLGNLEENDDEEEDVEETKQPLSRLVLQHRETQRQYSKGLDFRPLSPRITILLDPQELSDDTTQDNNIDNLSTDDDITCDDDDDDDDGEKRVTANPQPAVVGVWVGSADDTKLRLYQNTDNGNTDILVETKIICWKEDDESNDNQQQQQQQQYSSNSSLLNKTTEPISFQSPVMAIDTVSLSTMSQPTENLIGTEDQKETVPTLAYGNQGVVAVSCQDGTIRFFGYSWSSSESTLHCREECTVVIDGPIVSLHLNVKKVKINDDDYEEIEAVVGSLCGYVARFYRKIVVAISEPNDMGDDKTANINEFCWQGPFMVAEGFGTGPDAQEDSILAVHAWDDKVALGTFSGRCLLYGNDGSVLCGEDYGLPYWDCQLPDPIHGICHIPSQEKGAVQILVTTRRSLHVFQEIPQVYDPERTKRKLEMLLSHQRHNSFSLSHSRNLVATGTAATGVTEEGITTASNQPEELVEEAKTKEQLIDTISNEPDLAAAATIVLEDQPKLD